MPTSKVQPRSATPAGRAAKAAKAPAKRPAAPKAKTARSPGAAAKRPAGDADDGPSASALIDARIAELGDWRGAMLARLRALIKQADPGVTEEWKWATPVWSHHGLICTGEAYKKVVKMTFAKGASLPDPAGLFNSSLEGNVRRAIDFHEGAAPDEAALKALIRAAVAFNESSARK
jgi:hypothetical protein